MNAYPSNEILYFDKNFGIVTSNQIILSNSNKQEKLNISDIQSVRLIKKRVSSISYALFIAGIVFAVSTFLYFNTISTSSIIASIVGLCIIAMSFLLKFHRYHLVIKDHKLHIHVIKTNQWKREQIKKFYNSIVKEIKHHKKAA